MPYTNSKFSAPSLMNMSKFSNLEILNYLDQPVGKIQNYILNVFDLSVEYVVASFEALPGIKDNVYILPWRALKLDYDRCRFILPFEAQQLCNAPCYNAEEPDSAESGLLREVDDFYWEIYLKSCSC